MFHVHCVLLGNWVKKTPDNFRFTAKFPKVITHDKYLVDVEDEVEQFLENIKPLEEKTLALLIQLPPSMEITPGLESLRNFLPMLDGGFRYAVEVRHHSWFQDLAYNFFADNGICMVWSQLAELKTPPVVTTDFLYLRLIGDRSIQEKDFGRVQIDRVLDMQKWVDNLKTGEDEHIKLAIMTANNHYAGFGPGTVNIFRNMLGLPEAKWWEKQEEDEQQKHLEQYPASDYKQRTLSDFIN